MIQFKDSRMPVESEWRCGNRVTWEAKTPQDIKRRQRARENEFCFEGFNTGFKNSLGLHCKP